VVAHQLRELGLTAEAERQYPDLAPKILAVRLEAMATAQARCVARAAVVPVGAPRPRLCLRCICGAASAAAAPRRA
jgi:hypothetical protein